MKSAIHLLFMCHQHPTSSMQGQTKPGCKNRADLVKK